MVLHEQEVLRSPFQAVIENNETNLYFEARTVFCLVFLCLQLTSLYSFSYPSVLRQMMTIIPLCSSLSGFHFNIKIGFILFEKVISKNASVRLTWSLKLCQP